MIARHTAQFAPGATAPVTARRLRGEIAHALGRDARELREWNTRLCPDCRRSVSRAPRCATTGAPHSSPLYYALAPEGPTGDMPLGIGADATDALRDLLWNILAHRLLDDLNAERSRGA